MSRGPYKQYEYDPSVGMPKSTTYNKRKRLIEEVEQAEFINTGVDHDGDHETYGEISESEECTVMNAGVIDSDDIEDEEDFVEHTTPTTGENTNVEYGTNGSDNDEETHQNEPLYPGSNVTKVQSLLMILCFMLKHKLTDVALDALLMLLNTFFPNTVPSSKYKFYKFFKMENSQIHFYCMSCMMYMGMSRNPRQCQSCNKPFCESESMKNGHYFIYIPVRQQIEALLSNAKLYSHMTNRNLESLERAHVVSDITTSALYKELISRHGFTSNDISITWNTDGAAAFKSSKFGIWPLQATVNELPPHLRAKHMLLLGLWFGGKPTMNTFMKPFVEECTRLQEQGFLFSTEILPRHVFPLLFCGDAPARALVRNSKQFNGLYGCDWCESCGVTVDTNGGPPTRYYPHRTPVVMRNARNQAAYAMQASPDEPIKGAKGVTIIDLLPTFDTVRGIPTEYMHCVCQGVTRQMVNMWMDSKHHRQDYYIGRKASLVDERLLAISPPSEVHRAPRSITDRCHWKASEWRAFLFYSLIILQGILPARYLRHFFLYVYGVYMLLGDSISNECIKNCEACFTKFVIEMEDLYGLSSCTFNVHCLTHLAQCVKDCGPLWATSAFVFEAHNHVLLNMFNGTQYVQQQIVNKFLLKNKMVALMRSCIDENSNPIVKDVLHKLVDNVKFGHEKVGDGLATVGSGKFVTINVHMALAVQNLLGSSVHNLSGVFYERFLHNHKLYSARSYTRAKRHSNFNVYIQHSCFSYGVILGLLVFKPSCQCSTSMLQQCRCLEHNIVIIEPMLETGRTLFRDSDFKVTSTFIVEVQATDDVIAVFPTAIQRKCICVSREDKTYFCPLPYRIYGD